ncbi:hypothetical protein ACOXXX_04870 [Thalassococcus sp. BH17M4-6]|uniref:hypothetical protein n=1 Tax=Thalassococcus sp. BH17M4-6 TaxID=3413148 RepID=UPI003BE21E5A
MKGGYSALGTVWEFLEQIGVLGPAGKALLAMLLSGAVLLLGVWLYARYQRFRQAGGLRGVRTRRKVRTLRAQGQLVGEFTFADAAELAQTGTIRAKTLEEKVADSVVPIEILFSCKDHDIVYQFEMDYRSEKEVAAWVEVARVLKLPDVSRILEELVHMRRVIYHPDHDPEVVTAGGETIGDRLSRRAMELHDEFARIDGVARLRAAGERHLRQRAPHLLPLPTL